MITEKKSHRFSIAVAGGVAAALVFASAAGYPRSGSAATYTWDSSGIATTPSGVTDGPGTWSTSTANWWNSGTSIDQAWTNNAPGDTAVFGVLPAGSNPYAVTLAQATTASGIIFQNQNYTIAGGGNTLTMNGATSYATPDFFIAPNVAATISSNITKSPTTSSTYVNGGGTLTLSGTDSFASGLYLDNATLQVANGASIALGGSNSNFVLGTSAANSNYVQTGGSVAYPLAYIGNTAGDTSSFSISGGTFVASSGTKSNFNLAYKANSTMNVSGGSLLAAGMFTTGLAAATSATINVSGGTSTLSFNGNELGATSGAATTINVSGGGIFNMTQTTYLGFAAGSSGVLNILSGGTANLGGTLGLPNSNANAAAAAVINQSGGQFNSSGSMFIAWNLGQGSASVPGNATAYGAYLLSAGSLNCTAGNVYVGWEGHCMGLFSQTGGTANLAANLYTGGDANFGGTGDLDISGGLMIHRSGSFMYTATSGAATNGIGIVTVRGSGYLQEQTGNFLVATKAAAQGIVNDVSGGTLEVSRITTTAGTSTVINFDGGTLRAYNSTNAAGFLTGLTNAFVYPGGLTVDTNNFNITIPQTLSAPQGYEVGTTGSTIAIAGGSGGSGYIGPPVVTFSAPASGVQATGVAVLGTGGSVAGIIITSPGSGYTSAQPVTVTFNGNNTLATGVATTLASSFSVNANTLNASGGLTVVGGGTLTLAALANSYTGTTNVSNGALYLNGADNSSSIIVAGGSTLGGSGSTTAGITVNSGGTLNFSRNTGTFSTNGSLGFLGGATINVGGLSSYYDNNIPALSVGALTPSAIAGLIGINANPLGTTLVSGTYDLINYTGSIGGVGSSAFTLFSVPGLGSSQNAFLVNQNNQIDIIVTGPQPYWNGTGSDWKTSNAFTIVPGGSPETFQAGDADVFDDTAGSGTYGGNVSLSSSNVAPASVTFNNNSLAYTLSGKYGIVGNTSLNLIGNGTVTIANSNGYTGTTSIGPFATLQIGAGGASGSLSPSSAITVNGTLAFSRSDNIVQGLQFSSTISGGGGLTQLGPGTVTLTATNTYSGPTTISGGTLQLGTGAAGQDGSISGAGGVTDNGTLAYNLAGTQTVGYSIGGSGVLFKSGTGMLVLSNTNGYSGGTTVNSGTLQLNKGPGGGFGTLAPAATVSVNSGATLWVNATDALGYYSQYGSAGTIGLIGGTMTITAGIHTNVGYLNMTAGTLTSLGTGDSSGNYIFNAGVTTNASAVPSVINAKTIQLRGPGNTGTTGLVPFSVARGSGPVDLIVSSNFTGNVATSGLDISGGGIMWYTGAASYSGLTEIDSGTLQIGAGGAAGSLSTASKIYDYATLAFSRSDNIVQGLQFSSSISQSGGVTQLGPGTLTLNAANAYTGPTAILGGVLNATYLANEGSPSPIGAGSGYPNPADLVIDSGTLQYTGAAAQNSNWIFTVGPTGAATLDASGGPGGTLTLGSGGGYAIAFANSAAPATLTLTGGGAGVLGANLGDSGTGPNVTSLVKTGSGTWTLNGANTYSGTTTISSGTLNIAGVNAGTGPLNVNAGALYITGSAAATGISVASGAILGGSGSASSAAANVANGGILDLSRNAGNTFSLGGLTFAGQATINVDALANYAGNPVLSTGALATSSTAGLVAIDANLGGAFVVAGTYDLINYTGSIGGAGLAGFTLSVNGITSRQQASLVNVSNQIDVVVTGGIPYWNGNQPDWVSTGAFTLLPSGGTTTFQTGDTDIFDDSANTLAYGGTVLLNSGNVAPAGVVFNNTNLPYTLSGAYGITGSATLALTGSGSVTIANSNGYYGTTTIGSYGTLQIGGGGASGALSPSSSIAVNGTLAFSRSDNIVQGTQFSSTITGGGGLTQLGPGMVTLTAANTYFGPTMISGGTLQIGTGAAGQDGSILGIGGVTDNATLAYNLAGSQTASYSIGGSGNLSMIGTGTLVLAGSNGYSGSTTVTSGVLQMGNSAALAGSSVLSISAGTVDLHGYSPVTGALSGAPGALITNNGSATATLTANSTGVSTYAGVISDGSAQTALTVGGSGALVLTGNNTYSGLTTVTGGTLTVPAGGAINNGLNIYVGGPSGATLNVSGGLVASSYDVGFQSVFTLCVSYNGQPGTVNISGGTLNLAGASSGIVMGGNSATYGGAPATFTQTGGLVNVGYESIYLANYPGGVSQMTISGGTFNSGGNWFIGERDQATVTVGGNAVVNINNNMYINNNVTGSALNDTFYMQGGTVTQNAANFVVGNNTGTGTYDQTGGLFNTNASVYVGSLTATGDGVMVVSGGTFVETGGTMQVGTNSTSAGTLSVGGGPGLAGVYAPSVVFDYNSASATGVVNLLAKGALLTGQISETQGTGTFNFDGGTLGAIANSGTFMQGITAANVEENGGVIDNRGFAITIGQDLQHGGINAIDGGLTFTGGGTTTLSGTNTYNGTTTVVGGTLILANNEAVEDGGNLSVGTDLSAFGTVAPAEASHATAAAPVPEPGALALAVALLGCAGLYHRLRRRSK